MSTLGACQNADTRETACPRRLPLSTVGLLQYITPVMQFLIGVVVLHEQMPVARWWGFALVWVAIALLTFDSLRASRTTRLGRRSVERADAPPGVPTRRGAP